MVVKDIRAVTKGLIALIIVKKKLEIDRSRFMFKRKSTVSFSLGSNSNAISDTIPYDKKSWKQANSCYTRVALSCWDRKLCLYATLSRLLHGSVSPDDGLEARNIY